MNYATEVIEELLRTFEHTEKQNGVEALVSRFADMFLVAGPDGARAVRASDFALALPKRQKMFDEMGCRSTKLDSVVVTKLDERYVMAQTKWRMGFARGDGQVKDVAVGSTYIIDTRDEPKILFYLTHQEITTVLREAGILPK
jgi:hypothetical protein